MILFVTNAVLLVCIVMMLVGFASMAYGYRANAVACLELDNPPPSFVLGFFVLMLGMACAAFWLGAIDEVYGVQNLLQS